MKRLFLCVGLLLLSPEAFAENIKIKITGVEKIDLGAEKFADASPFPKQPAYKITLTATPSLLTLAQNDNVFPESPASCAQKHTSNLVILPTLYNEGRELINTELKPKAQKNIHDYYFYILPKSADDEAGFAYTGCFRITAKQAISFSTTSNIIDLKLKDLGKYNR